MREWISFIEMCYMLYVTHVSNRFFIFMLHYDVRILRFMRFSLLSRVTESVMES